MTLQEWTTVDKSKWDRGPWDVEPDKVQWVDEASGLDCLMVRGPGGHWCGYVGVGPEHPLHGKDYDSAYVDVHGGLTFSGGCQEPTEARWRAHIAKAESPALIAEAAKHPKGDAAERLAALREQAALSFAEWVEYTQARAICHVPLPGRPDDVWWFGFDCAHSGDLSPKYQRQYREWGIGSGRRDWETYKDRAYVEGECRNLASQLARVSLPLPESAREASGVVHG